MDKYDVFVGLNKFNKLYAKVNGDVVMMDKYDSAVYMGNGFFRVEKQNKSGLVNIEGVEIIPCVYEDITDVRDLFKCYTKQNETFFVYDKNGVKLSESEFIEGENRNHYLNCTDVSLNSIRIYYGLNYVVNSDKEFVKCAVEDVKNGKISTSQIPDFVLENEAVYKMFEDAVASHARVEMDNLITKRRGFGGGKEF